MTFTGLTTLVLILSLTEVIPFCAAYSPHHAFLKQTSRHKRAHRTHHGDHRVHHHSLARWTRSIDTTALDVVKKQNIKSQMKQQQQELIIKTKWEESLLSAPYAVSLIGMLILLAAERDFDLYRSSNHTYQELRHWRFQPALIQLSNYAWGSFNAAQRNTDRISLLMIEIPRNMKQAIRILVKGDAKSIGRFLPIPLGLVDEAVEESIVLATETEASFLKTMILLQDISESLSATDSHNDQKLIDMRRQIENAKMEQKLLEELKANQQKQLDKVEKELEADRRKFEKAMDDIPTGWEAVFMGMVQNFNPMNIITAFTGGGLFGGGGSGGGGSGNSGATPQSVESQQDAKVQQLQAFKMSENTVEQFNIFLAKLDEWLSQLEGGSLPAELQEIQEKLANYLDALIKGAKTNLEKLQTMNLPSFLTPIVAMVESGVAILENFKAGIQQNSNELKQFLRNIKSELGPVLGSAKKFAALGAKVTGSSSVGASSTGGGGNAVGSNERFAAAQRKSVYLSSRKRYDDYWMEVERLNGEVQHIILELSQMKMDEVDVKKMQVMIHKAMDKMETLQKLWNKLIEFFQTLARSVKISLKYGVNSFTRFANKTGTGIIEDGGDKASLLMAKEFMMESSYRVAIVAKSVYSVTSAYVNASKLYVMPQISGISGLQTLEGADNEAMKDKLVKSTEVAKVNIYAMAKKRKGEFQTLVDDQLEEIDGIFQITGQPTAEDQAAIEAATEEFDDFLDF